jgi:hypothetical protein
MILQVVTNVSKDPSALILRGPYTINHEVFSGDQLCHCRVGVPSFRDSACILKEWSDECCARTLYLYKTSVRDRTALETVAPDSHWYPVPPRTAWGTVDQFHTLDQMENQRNGDEEQE